MDPVFRPQPVRTFFSSAVDSGHFLILRLFCSRALFFGVSAEMWRFPPFFSFFGSFLRQSKSFTSPPPLSSNYRFPIPLQYANFSKDITLKTPVSPLFPPFWCCSLPFHPGECTPKPPLPPANFTKPPGSFPGPLSLLASPPLLFASREFACLFYVFRM